MLFYPPAVPDGTADPLHVALQNWFATSSAVAEGLAVGGHLNTDAYLSADFQNPLPSSDTGFPVDAPQSPVNVGLNTISVSVEVPSINSDVNASYTTVVYNVYLDESQTEPPEEDLTSLVHLDEWTTDPKETASDEELSLVNLGYEAQPPSTLMPSEIPSMENADVLALLQPLTIWWKGSPEGAQLVWENLEKPLLPDQHASPETYNAETAMAGALSLLASVLVPEALASVGPTLFVAPETLAQASLADEFGRIESGIYMTEYDMPFQVGDLRIGGTSVPSGPVGGIFKDTAFLEQRVDPIVIARDWTSDWPNQESGVWWSRQSTLTETVGSDLDRAGNAILPDWNRMDSRTLTILPPNKTVIGGMGGAAYQLPGGYEQLVIPDMDKGILGDWGSVRYPNASP